MVVACPACHTRYRVDGSVTLAGETSFECSQEECKRIFVYTPPVLWKGNASSDVDSRVDPPIPDSSSQQEPASQNDATHSPHVEASGPEPAAGPASESASEPMTGPAPGFLDQGTDTWAGAGQTLGAHLQSMTDQQNAAEGAAEDTIQEFGPKFGSNSDQDSGPDSRQDFHHDSVQSQIEHSFAPPPSVSTMYRQEEEDEESRLKFAYRDQAEQEYETDDQYKQGEVQEYEAEEAFLPIRTVFFLLVGFVLGYAALGYYALSDLQGTKLTLRNLPFVGNVFAAEPFSKSHITLTNLTGSFWLSKDNRRVFAVAGTAINNASSPARLVQIEGTLYNQVGKKVGQEIVFCGNEANSNLLESLTVRDIETLQKLVPPKDFRIPAGQEVNCLLVFTKPPATVAELGGRVVSARFEEPHGPLASAQLGEAEAGRERPERSPQL